MVSKDDPNWKARYNVQIALRASKNGRQREELEGWDCQESRTVMHLVSKNLRRARCEAIYITKLEAT